MQLKTAGLAILVVWVWLLIWDNFLGAFVLGPAWAQIPGVVESFPKVWEVVGDLFAAAVLVWVYSKTRGSFNAGVKGGVTYGLYAGILMNFPGWLWMALYAGWPYAATWHMVIILTLLTVVSGALIGLVAGKSGGAAAA